MTVELEVDNDSASDSYPIMPLAGLVDVLKWKLPRVVTHSVYHTQTKAVSGSTGISPSTKDMELDKVVLKGGHQHLFQE